jgi:transcriptional regulator with XRE-family HTH domain
MADEMGAPQLRRIRRRRLLTQEDLARLAGVGKSTISRAEKGRAIRVSTLKRLAAALEVSAGELMGEPRRG